MERLKAVLYGLFTGRSKYRKAVMALAITVVFITTYMLILPALTLDKTEAEKQGGIDVPEITEVSGENGEETAAGEGSTGEAADAAGKKTVAAGETSGTAANDGKADEAAKTESGKETANAAGEGKDAAPAADPLAYIDENYTITVEDDRSVLPGGTEIQVEEIEEKADSKEYQKYYDDALEAVQKEDGSENVSGFEFARFYDISLLSDGEEIQPENAVSVRIEYDKELRKALGVKDEKNLRIVHFAENEETGKVEAEVLDTKDAKVEVTTDSKDRLQEASFEADSFSVYAVVYTVDFSYSVDGKTFEYSIDGGGVIALTDLVRALNVVGDTRYDSPYDLTAHVKDVVFSNERLIRVYKDNGEWMLESLCAFDTDETLTILMDDGAEILIRVTDAQSTDGLHSDLSDMLTSVTIKIDGQNVTGSTWNVEKGKNYDITLSYAEEPNTSLQVDTNGSLTFKVPDGVSLVGMTKDLVLTYTDEEGHTQKLTGNTFTVDPDTNTITLNLDEDSKAKIETSGKASFDLHITGSFERSESGMPWSDNIKRDVVVEENHDINISKSVVSIDQVTNKVTYQVTVTSKGHNENVVVTDTVTGTALTLNDDIESSGTNADPAISKDGNSFSATYSAMEDGETAVITYTANVDRGKITGTGTKEETGNEVTVDSSETDEKKTATDLEHQIRTEHISKSMTSWKDGSEPGHKTATWAIVYNADQQANANGRYVKDTIAEDSQNIMKYSGTGITVTRYKTVGGSDVQQGDPQSISWDNLNKTDSSWQWNISGENDIYKYVITYTTDVYVGDSMGWTNVKNGATDGGNGTEGGGNVGPGFNPELNKTVEYTDDKKGAEWTVTFKVPKGGLDKAVVTDTLPSTWGGLYRDTLDEDVAITVTETVGSGEPVAVDPSLYDITTETGKVVITFKKVDGDPGIAAIDSDEERVYTVKLTTKFDDNWLTDLPTTQHTNSVNLNGDVSAHASILPVPNPSISKKAERAGEINGKAVYRYTVNVTGYDGGNFVLTDTYNKALKYYDIHNAQYSETNQVQGIDTYWHEYLFGISSGWANSSRVTKDFTLTEDISGTENNTFTLTVPESKMSKKSDGTYYPEYRFVYYLILDDKEAMNQASVDANGKIKLNNKVNWNSLSDKASVEYEYPAVTKKLTNKDDIAGKTVADDHVEAEFEIVLNPDMLKLNKPGEGDTLTVTDDFNNLSVNYSSVKIEAIDKTGKDVSDSVQWNFKGTTGTFIIPDETKVKITYEARVTTPGLGIETPFGNTVRMKGWSDSVNEKTTAGGDGSGKVPQYSIRIFKYDGINMQSGISGAVYTLTDDNGNPVLYPSTASPATIVKPYVDVNGVEHPTLDEGNKYPRAGKPITFVTTKGYVSVLLDQTLDGISLQPGIRYHFKETYAPNGWQISNINYAFTISETPDYSNWEYYTGDIVKITDYPTKGMLELEKSIAITDKNNNTAVDDVGGSMTLEQQKSLVYTIEMVDENGEPVMNGNEKAYFRTITYADFSNGKYRLEDLSAGTYKVTETNYALAALTYTGTDTVDMSTDGYSGSIDNTKRVYTFTVSEDEAGGKVRVDHVVKYTNNYDEADYKIVLKKTSEDEQIGLYGAVFKVEYREPGSQESDYTLLTNGSFGEDGTFTIPYSAKDSGVTLRSLKNGYYKITEIKSPEGYRIKGDGVFEFKIIDGKVTQISTNDYSVSYTTPYTFDVQNGIEYGYKFTKHEKGNVSVKLSGAEFTVYEYNPNGEDSEVMVYTSDNDGNFEILFSDKGENGNAVYQRSTQHDKHLYYIKETKSPTGYKATDAKYYFYWPETDSVTIDSAYISDAGGTTAEKLGSMQKYALIPNEQQTTEITFTKQWKNTDINSWPLSYEIPAEEVEFVIWQTPTVDGEEQEPVRYPDENTTYTIKNNGWGNWQTTVKGLPTGSSIGGHTTKYAYRAEEINVPEGFVASYNADGTEITNRPEPVSLPVKKAWSDNTPEDKKWDTINAYLYRDYTAVELAQIAEEIDDSKLSAALQNPTDISSLNNMIDVYNQIAGYAAPGYMPKLDKLSTGLNRYFELTSRSSELIAAANKASSMFNAIANGTSPEGFWKQDDGQKTIQLKKENNWEGTFENLSKDVTWHVIEEKYNRDNLEKDFVDTYSDNNVYVGSEITDQTTATITNTYKKVRFTVNKTWIGETNKPNITIVFHRKHLGDAGEDKTFNTGNNSDKWKYTVYLNNGTASGTSHDFDAVDSNGEQWYYWATEEVSGDYIKIISATEDNPITSGTVEVTNIKENTTGISVYKQWDVPEGAELPKSVTVQLMKAAEIEDSNAVSITITEINQWNSNQTYTETIKVKSGTDVKIYTGYNYKSYESSEYKLTVKEQWGTISNVTQNGSITITAGGPDKKYDYQKAVTPDLKNGSPTGNEVTLNNANKWYYAWNDLEDGYYFIAETGVGSQDVSDSGYTVTYSDNNNGIKTGTITITNTKTNAEPVEVKKDLNISKSWLLSDGGTAADEGDVADFMAVFKLYRKATDSDPGENWLINSTDEVYNSTGWEEIGTYTLAAGAGTDASNPRWSASTGAAGNPTFNSWSVNLTDLLVSSTDSANPSTDRFYIYKLVEDSIIRDGTSKSGSEYNPTFTITNSDASGDDGSNSGKSVAVTNTITSNGVELPHTGGPGTTLFYLIGGLLLIAPGILLIHKRKKLNN